jgi:hypothetical protein
VTPEKKKEDGELCEVEWRENENIGARARLFADSGWDSDRFCFQGTGGSGTLSFIADTAVFDNLRALSKALDAWFFSTAPGPASSSFTLLPKKDR